MSAKDNDYVTKAELSVQLTKLRDDILAEIHTDRDKDKTEDISDVAAQVLVNLADQFERIDPQFRQKNANLFKST